MKPPLLARSTHRVYSACMRDIVPPLAALRREFGGTAAARKLRLILAASSRTGTARLLRAWHDEVLFCCAYPDDAALRRAAEHELRRLGRLARARTSAEGSPLHNSGIAGTTVTASFSPDLLRWLVERFGPAVNLAWEDGAAGMALEELLPLLALPPETDGLLSHRLTTEDWVRHAAGGHRSALAWLLHRVETLQLKPGIRDRLFAAHDLFIRWRLGHGSRTLTRFPPRPLFLQRQPLTRHVVLGEVLRDPLPRPVSLGRRGQDEIIDIARATLAARARETDPVTFANPTETKLFRLERGVDIALFGMQPARRLPIESYFGFVAARNRIPIAYGGGWVFFGRCEIGVNLFEEFRGGESAVIFAQVLRAYRQHYRVRQFLVDPYQFGKDNTEAIRSGAFWFYYRLGFRPTDPALWRLADQEFGRIHAQHGYRSPARTLRRFTASKLFLDVPVAERGKAPVPERGWQPVAPDLTELGLALTGWVERHYRGDREAAARHAIRRVNRLLGATNVSRWTPSEQEGWQRLALLATACLRSAWTGREREALREALRAKGGERERDYALRLQRLPRFRTALEAFSRTARQMIASG
jgi:hypothetical protein